MLFCKPNSRERTDVFVFKALQNSFQGFMGSVFFNVKFYEKNWFNFFIDFSQLKYADSDWFCSNSCIVLLKFFHSSLMICFFFCPHAPTVGIKGQPNGNTCRSWTVIQKKKQSSRHNPFEYFNQNEAWNITLSLIFALFLSIFSFSSTFKPDDAINWENLISPHSKLPQQLFKKQQSWRFQKKILLNRQKSQSGDISHFIYVESNRINKRGSRIDKIFTIFFSFVLWASLQQAYFGVFFFFSILWLQIGFQGQKNLFRIHVPQNSLQNDFEF